MKKFEFPEVKCVKLSEIDVIMVGKSAEVGNPTNDYMDVESQLTKDYKIWKGFSN